MEALVSVLSASDVQTPGSQELLRALQLPLPDCHITSPGGCGSSHLSAFLNRHGFSTNLQIDSDALRHCNRPPRWSSTARPGCVIYLYGDPIHVVASHFRRGHAWHQALKTCGTPRLQEQRSQAAFPSSLEEYTDKGLDLFGLEVHFCNWRAGAPGYEIVMVKYEDMFDFQVALAMFSCICSAKGLPLAQAEALATEWTSSQRNRLSQVPESCLRSTMYSRLQEEMRALAPLLVVPKAHTHSND